MKLSVTVPLICVVVLIGGNRHASPARQRNPTSVVLARHEPQAAAISVDETKVYLLRDSSFTDVQVAGTWDAQFSGTVGKKGTPHDDIFVMELKQKGSRVTGTLRFERLGY